MLQPIDMFTFSHKVREYLTLDDQMQNTQMWIYRFGIYKFVKLKLCIMSE